MGVQRTTAKRWCALVCVLASLMLLGGCGSSTKLGGLKSSSASRLQPVRISHISQHDGGQELMLRSMSLVGTPYRYGGSSRDSGFDCSGMVKYLYQEALQVRLPRTAKDIAAVSSPIRAANLQVGDLVFFNTSGQPYSHMGIYIGNGEFIHAPSSKGSIRIARLDQPYFSRRFTDARTLFLR